MTASTRNYVQGEALTIPAGTAVHVAVFHHEGQEFLDLTTISTEIGRTMQLAHKACRNGAYNRFAPRCLTLTPTLFPEEATA